MRNRLLGLDLYRPDGDKESCSNNTDEEDEDCALQQEVSHLVSPPTKQITTTFNDVTS